MPQKNHAWLPPADGYMKLNVDGNWKAQNEAGGGAVFRGSEGTWYMGFASKFNVITPLAAELYSIREGLMMAVDYGIKKLELKTDAEILVKMVQSVEDSYHHDLSPVLKDVACLMTRGFPTKAGARGHSYYKDHGCNDINNIYIATSTTMMAKGKGSTVHGRVDVDDA
ncbi:uncharacterized protein [Spinacia oleracea]|uniref:RNase H type-1 domain-containing protein n=1 Tax=Spinacia oleracea TaxID=3562 RepID=A0A9R0JUR5_SPIOL|nr:uncharacterized protein LOC110787017 [Spinacia oleracea]